MRTVLHLSGLMLGLIFFNQVLTESILEIGSPANIFIPGSWKVLLALPIYGLVYTLQIINFRRILSSCFDKKISLTGLIKSYSLSFIAKYIPGSIWGYLSRGELLTKQEGVPAAYTWMASAIEIIITVVSGCSLIAAYYMVLSGYAYLWTLPVMVIVWVLIWLGIPKSVRIASRLFKREMRVDPIKLPFVDFMALFFNGCLQWLLLGIGLLVITNGMGEKLPIFNAMQLFGSIAAFTTAWLGGFVIPILPNGMGVREITLVRLLTANLGISIPIAGLTAVLSRVLLMFTELGLVVFAATLNLPGAADKK